MGEIVWNLISHRASRPASHAPGAPPAPRATPHPQRVLHSTLGVRRHTGDKGHAETRPGGGAPGNTVSHAGMGSGFTSQHCVGRREDKLSGETAALGGNNGFMQESQDSASGALMRFFI